MFLVKKQSLGVTIYNFIESNSQNGKEHSSSYFTGEDADT